MRLKNIELKGFKSFGNSTVLHFNEDVVGVVGPNGSGKSNIVDAFRWVLGEQKTTGLRLEKMADVLFNGTKTRKPANTCSVTLTFDNNKGILPSEYNEIAISRHLYRSGNSEYRLNGVSCRLKDITTLLSDTGIASNSYAIIALDMVDDILSDKDHARRRMFEQAAGISKFKQRKKEVENKLRASESDLERVQDLLFEISANLNELEKQAKKARSYNKVKAKYRHQSMLLAGLKIQDYLQSHKNIKLDLRTKTEEVSGIRAKMSVIEAEIQKARKDNLLEEEKLNTQQKKLAEIIQSLNKLENQKQLNKQSSANLSEGIADRENRITALNEEARKVATRLEYLRNQMSQETATLGLLDNKLDLIKLEKSNSADAAEKVKSIYHQSTQDLQSLEGKLNELDRSILIKSNKLEGIEAEINRLLIEEKVEKDKERELSTELQQSNKKLESLTKKREVLLAKEEERKNKISALLKEKSELEEKQRGAERKLDALNNEHRLLKSMLEKMEGYPESIKHLSNQKHWKQHAALLSELIFCPEQYRPAVEAILEPWLDNYVVPGWKDAMEGIAILQKGQKGKARFLLLDGFREEDMALEQITDFIPALSIVQVEDTYLPLFARLLQGVYIFKMDRLPDILPENVEAAISSDGRVIRRKYSAEGGSGDLFSGKKIGRQKALDLLQDKIKSLKTEVEKNKSAIQKVAALLSKLESETRDKEIALTDKEIAEVSSLKAALIATRSSGEDIIRKRQQRLKEIGAEQDLLQKESRELKLQKMTLEEEIKEKSTLVESNRKKLEEALELKGSRSDEFNRMNIEFIRQQNKLSGFKNEMEFQSGRINDIQSESQNLKKYNDEARHQTDNLKEEFRAIEEQLIDLYTKKKAAEGTLNEREQQYFKSKNSIFEREKELNTLSKNASDLQFVLENMKEKNREVEFGIRAIKERISVEFDTDLPSNAEDFSEEELNTDRTDLQQKIERLKARLSNFGEVNPLALEAFEEMKLRHDDIVEQRQDIENARDSLRETIREIETTAKERYVEAYERIRFNFINVFRSLFTEDDNCDLVMTNPDLPLESDIEIIAKPKGKRPQSISQLSGGEKTLTAISLLFALYLLKPAPFCIFDEVDAPLDDANIEKFNRIIKRFSNESQFIIVTHNKQTMSHLDIIYGVYMEESGVSGVSAVDFRALKNVDFLTDVQEREF
ncbi:MAG: chromosome segregation protein SMC [Saprospirales bacterium]|nr:MAG: chromosome segregation protein SMC [Saprospirales bacterium]